ncbi:Colicin D [Kosakonia arachidis]|uniref:Colicin D n=1 Tax=Kosakonia arachidis TaxID=551989 RepID=A0A1I7C7T1_9ENTR|nr:colicin D domain-containing protein [Kosakonia arachidis]SFT95490.1 Colicin D [Kosakonia arachidis]
MLHHYQAKSLDNIYLEDIPHIIHPDYAARDLVDTTLPNRNIQEWNLPQSYSQFVSQYYQFHHQCPWLAYRDTHSDIKSGKVVLLRKDMTGYTVRGVLTLSGNLRDDLPLFLHTRLHYLISHQLKRPVYYVRPSAPVQHAQAAKTINSKAAGRLLAAGGIYNGNIEGFRKTAEQLGGDAPAGYDQVMDNKGLLITGASVAAALGIGRLTPVNEIETLSNLSKTPKPSPSTLVSFESRQLQKKFKHAVDFNVPGNPNAEGLKSFEQALKSHIDDPLTNRITGKYRWNQDVYHYYNPETKLNVMTKPDGNFISGWKLSDTQSTDLIGNGNVF